jgi:hypothetical protein
MRFELFSLDIVTNEFSKSSIWRKAVMTEVGVTFIFWIILFVVGQRTNNSLVFHKMTN